MSPERESEPKNTPERTTQIPREQETSPRPQPETTPPALPSTEENSAPENEASEVEATGELDTPAPSVVHFSPVHLQDTDDDPAAVRRRPNRKRFKEWALKNLRKRRELITVMDATESDLEHLVEQFAQSRRSIESSNDTLIAARQKSAALLQDMRTLRINIENRVKAFDIFYAKLDLHK